MKNILNFGIIGCGRIFSKHLNSIKNNKNSNLIAVCDIKEDLVKKVSEENNCKSYTNYLDMLKDQEIDIISICTPSGLHPEMVINVAKNKKHILVEKPMALTVVDANEMIRIARENGVRLFVVKQNRLNPSIQELKNALDLGRLGKIHLLNTTVRWCRPQEYYDQAEWRGTKNMDGGVLMNQASHHVDLIRWFGGEADSVFAYSSTHRNIEVEDTAVAVIKFKNGALGTIEASTCTSPKDLEGSITVLGDKGSVEIGGFAVNKINTWEFSEANPGDEDISEKSTNPLNVYGFSHELIYRDVINSILTGEKGLIEGEEGIKSIEIIEAIYKSVNENKEIKL